MLKMEVPGRRKRGRRQRRYMDVTKEDVQMVGVTEQDIRDRMRWWQVTAEGEHLKERKMYTHLCHSK